MNWLINKVIILSPLALIVIILIAVALGWTVYALRGYRYWLNRFQRYPYGMTRVKRRYPRVRNRYYYQNVEFPQYPTSQVPLAPQKRAPISPKKASSLNNEESHYQTPIEGSKKDDLQVIEGVGPRIEEVLNNNGIHTWRELSQTPEKDLKLILEKSGLGSHDPKTWSKQAYMADNAYWDELKEYQDILFGGRE